LWHKSKEVGLREKWVNQEPESSGSRKVSRQVEKSNEESRAGAQKQPMGPGEGIRNFKPRRAQDRNKMESAMSLGSKKRRRMQPKFRRVGPGI